MSEGSGTSQTHRLLDFADRLRRGDGERVEDTETPETWVAFSVAGQLLALPIELVLEVAPMTSLTKVPKAPPSVSGVTSLRGRSIPVVDLSRILEMPGESSSSATHILVVEHQGRSIGLAVDRVQRVFKLLASRVEKVRETASTLSSSARLGTYAADGATMTLLAADFLSPLERSH